MLPEPVIHLLRVQRGVVATRQLRGLTTAQRRRVLEREPELERLTPRVLRHRVADRSREQHLVAAVLDTGSLMDGIFGDWPAGLTREDNERDPRTESGRSLSQSALSRPRT